MKLNRWSLFFLIGVVFLLQNVVYAAEPAGTVGYVKGVVSAKSNTGGSRLLAKDAPIYSTDSIVTGDTSFVVLSFKDGTKMTIRPKSVFVISNYSFKQSNNDKASFRLLKGGLRAVTGKINKNKTEKMRITTPVATMGVRGTDFIARLCDGDCNDPKKGKRKDNTIVRLALAKGKVQIKTEKGTRQAKTGDRFKAKDTLITDATGFAVLVFDDNTRVTVQPSSELSIAEYSLPKGRPKQGKVSLSLKKGGARTLTGRIAKANPSNFKVKTPTATMGIRGTGFDTQFNGQTYVSVWQGAVTANQGGQTQNIGLNQTFQIGNGGFNQLAQLPANMAAQFNRTPRPDKAKTQSIWVSVKSGKVVLIKNQPKGTGSTATGLPTTGKIGNNNNNTDPAGNTSTAQQGGGDDGDGNKDGAGKDNDGGGDKKGGGKGGDESVEITAGETGRSNEAGTVKTEEQPSFIANDPYTDVAPNNVEATSDVFGNPSDNKSCTVN